MTEALKTWVATRTAGNDDDAMHLGIDFGMTHALSVKAAEFWIRAFCEEVEKRAKQMALANSHSVPHDPNFVDYSEAFEHVKRELLGP